jgi:hypothetical protein
LLENVNDMGEQEGEQRAPSTQNTQYDKIGTKYNAIKVLSSVEPEEPSVVKALGNIEGSRCLGTFTLSHMTYPSFNLGKGPVGLSVASRIE